jgi:hypothetical protein
LRINSTNYNDFAPTVLASIRSSRPPCHKINCPFRPEITYWLTAGNVVHRFKIKKQATSTGAVLAVQVAEQWVQNGGFETGSFSSWGESGNFVDCSVSSGFPAVHSGNYGALLGPEGSLGYRRQRPEHRDQSHHRHPTILPAPAMKRPG